VIGESSDNFNRRKQGGSYITKKRVRDTRLCREDKLVSGRELRKVARSSSERTEEIKLNQAGGLL